MADNRIAYGMLKKAGVDTEGMSPKEAWEKVKELGLTDFVEQVAADPSKPNKESVLKKSSNLARNVNITSDSYETMAVALDTIESIMNEYGLDKLETIATVDTQLGNSSINPAQATQQTLHITNAFLENPNALYVNLNSCLERKKEEYEFQRHFFVMIPDNDINAKNNCSKKLEKLSEIVKYNRMNVLYAGSEVDCVITHEMGHVFYKQTFFKAPEKIEKIKLAYEKAKERGDLYALSFRSSDNEREFFSEALSLYRLNQEPIPEYISRLMKEVL